MYVADYERWKKENQEAVEEKDRLKAEMHRLKKLVEELNKQGINLYIYIDLYACMHACLYVRGFAYYIYMCLYWCVYMYTYMYVCICGCLRIIYTGVLYTHVGI